MRLGWSGRGSGRRWSRDAAEAMGEAFHETVAVGVDVEGGVDGETPGFEAGLVTGERGGGGGLIDADVVHLVTGEAEGRIDRRSDIAAAQGEVEQEEEFIFERGVGVGRVPTAAGDAIDTEGHGAGRPDHSAWPCRRPPVGMSNTVSR
jgi:hypothetical protein